MFEISSLRNVERGWRQHLGVDCANDLEHTIRVAWMALMIARSEGVTNEEKILKMALVHDMAETRTSDHSYVQKVYVQADEEKAADHLFEGTTIANMREVLAEYDARQSMEAKIVKDADNLDIDLELKELAETGHKLPEKWKTFRRKIRDEKLYTNTAQEMWDEFQTADVHSWHFKANKWVKIPKAGL